MSSNSDPVCTRCKATSSFIWQRDQKGAVICLECHSTEKSVSKAPSNLGSVSLDPQSSGKQNNLHKSLSKMSQQSSSSSSSSSSSVAEVSVSGVTTRRTTRSHEREKARQQQQQFQQEAVLQKLEASGSSVEESENASVDETQSKDKCKLAIGDKSTPHDTPSNRVDSITTQGLGNCGGPSSPDCPTSSRRNLRQGHPERAPDSQPYVLTCSSIEHHVSRPWICLALLRAQ